MTHNDSVNVLTKYNTMNTLFQFTLRPDQYQYVSLSDASDYSSCNIAGGAATLE